MEALRSSFIAAIVSLFVLTGYAHDLFGDCDDHRRSEPAAAILGAPAKEVPQHSEDTCQCLCHQAVSNVIFEPVRLGGALPVVDINFSVCGEYPPDAVPSGVDHPPQLV